MHKHGLLCHESPNPRQPLPLVKKFWERRLQKNENSLEKVSLKGPNLKIPSSF